MPVPPAQLAVLATLERPKPVLEVAEANGLTHDAAYKAIRALEHEGLVETHRRGKDLVAATSSKPLPTLARSLLFDTPRDDWDLVMHGDRPVVLHVLDRVGDPALTAQVCGKARSTVYHVTKLLAPRGVLVRRNKRYALNPRLLVLREFLEEFAKAQAHHRVHAIDASARLIWHLGPELFLKTRNELARANVHVAGLSRFAEYDVPLLAGDAGYYYVATRRLDAADAIFQALLVDPESRVNRSYAALVYENTRPASLKRKAAIYGLHDDAEALVQYVDTHEPTDGFLPWSDHERYREQYGLRS